MSTSKTSIDERALERLRRYGESTFGRKPPGRGLLREFGGWLDALSTAPMGFFVPARPPRPETPPSSSQGTVQGRCALGHPSVAHHPPRGWPIVRGVRAGLGEIARQPSCKRERGLGGEARWARLRVRSPLANGTRFWPGAARPHWWLARGAARRFASTLSLHSSAVQCSAVPSVAAPTVAHLRGIRLR